MALAPDELAWEHHNALAIFKKKVIYILESINVDPIPCVDATMLAPEDMLSNFEEYYFKVTAEGIYPRVNCPEDFFLGVFKGMCIFIC